MRADAIGLFWEDLPPEPKEKKVTFKKIPPNPYWDSEGFVPELNLPKAPLLSDHELTELSIQTQLGKIKPSFVFDVESYPNLFTLSFLETNLKKAVSFLIEDDQKLKGENFHKLKWILSTFTTIGFNSNFYDIPITTLALAGYNTSQLFEFTKKIIEEDIRPWDLLKSKKVKKLKDIDHIDLIEVAPGNASLKLYAGRIHSRQIQDLLFKPGTILTNEQKSTVSKYLTNDLYETLDVYNELKPEIDLRVKMSKQYGVDLRSKSRAQVAEKIITIRLESALGYRPRKPQINPNYSFLYQKPDYISFQSPLMNSALDIITTSEFKLSQFGKVLMPDSIKSLLLKINNSEYQMGIGGLHSRESGLARKTTNTHILIDRDVTSYYPYLILNCGFYPEHLGKVFLTIYKSIVNERVEAKQIGEAFIAEVLKIVINGSFGKLGSPMSILYSPNLMVQVTLTGQLSLLMLIETLELAGVEVLSGNTDGIVINCPRSRRDEVNGLILDWEKVTGLQTEETIYEALYSRDVNNYIAIKSKDDIKRKGFFRGDDLDKNPQCQVITESIISYLTSGIPIEKFITNHQKVSDFVSLRTVKGGAVQVWDSKEIPLDVRNEKDAHDYIYANYKYLGKAVRWYYAKDYNGYMVYAKSGNLVPRSQGGKPCLILPNEIPKDIDYDWYINEAYETLKGLGIN